MSEGSTAASTSVVVPFFKKKSRPSKPSLTSTAVGKKRSPSPLADGRRDDNRRREHPEEEEEDGSSVVRLTRKELYNPLKQGSSAKRRRRHLQPGENNDDDDDNDQSDNFNDGISSVAISYRDQARQSRRSASPSSHVLTGDAALVETGERPADDGLYHGAANYQAQLPAGSSKFGPIKGPSASIKTITLVDYQPDVCKDYKETGWCGFGDSCKFLHDRGDYLHGWQMDNMYLSNKPAAETAAAQETLEEELPFACIICREPFADPPHDPVVTRCSHYFGASCAIKRFRKTPKCYACGAATGGMFNKATKLLERKEKNQKERIRQKEQEEGETDYGQNESGVEIEGLTEE